MISRYVQSGICEETQKLFAEMEENDVQPNEFTLATVVKA
jgi:pentatricopeptide repeat protein